MLGKSRKGGARPALFQISYYLCCSFVIYVVLCIVCVQMCIVLLPPGVNPIADDKQIKSYEVRIITAYSFNTLLNVVFDFGALYCF